MKEVIFIALIMAMIIPLVNAQTLARLEPVFSEYTSNLITGNETCYVDIRFYGREGRNVSITVRSIAGRTCQICPENATNEGDCRQQRIDPPLSLPVHLRNHTRFVDLPLRGGQFNFSIRPEWDRFLQSFRIGNHTIYIQGDVSYNATFASAEQRAGDSGGIDAYAFLSHNITGYWNNLKLYMPYDRPLKEDGDTGTTVTEYDHSRSQLSGTTTCLGGLCLLPNGFYTTGIYGNAFRTNTGGNTLYTTMGDQPKLTTFGQNYTWMAWVWLNASEVDVTARGVMRKGHASSVSAALQDFRVTLTGASGLSITAGNGSGTGQTIINKVVGGGNLTRRWTHIAWTLNASDRYMVYVNGINETRIDGVNKTFVRFYGASNRTLIGIGTESGSTPFQGMIDEIMIFNTSLTQAEVQEIYNNQSDRYPKDGSMTFTYVNLSGNNTIAINATVYQNLSTIVNVSVNNGAEQGFTGGTTGLFNVSGPFNAANITFHFHKGNISDWFFYSPMVLGTITIEARDTAPPLFYNVTAQPQSPINYSVGHVVTFNATWIDETTVAGVTFFLSGTYYNPTYIGSNQYQISFTDLLPGTYTYIWNATDINGNSNTTQSASYRINLLPYANFSGNMSIGYINPDTPRVNIFYPNFTEALKIGWRK